MDSFIYSLWPVVGYVSMLLFIIFIAWIYEYKKREKKPSSGLKHFEMDEKPLTSQTLFWLAIVIPFFSFCYFGFFSWYGKPILFNANGFERFIKISALPLGLLSLSIPFAAVINNIHRTIQTNKQIQETGVKNNHDLYYSHRNNTINYFNNIGVLKSEYNYKIIKAYTEQSTHAIVELSIINSFHLYDFLFYHSTPNLCILSPMDSVLFKINKAWGRINYMIKSCIADSKNRDIPLLTRLRKLTLINKNLNIIEKRLHLNSYPNKFNIFQEAGGYIEFCVKFRSYEEFNEKLKLSYELSKKIYSIIGRDLDKYVDFKFVNLFLSENKFLFSIINNEHYFLHKNSFDIGVCFAKEQPF